MEIKSCETCKYDYLNGCEEIRCRDCPMMDDEFGYCKCADIEDVENCPYYKKHEPTPSADEISSSD